MDDIYAVSADSLLRRSPAPAYKAESKTGDFVQSLIYIMVCTFSPTCLFFSVRGKRSEA